MSQHDILLVEDDPSMREYLQYILRDAGYTVTAATTASEACDCLASSSFDLLITDHFLSGMLGAELITRVRVSHPRMRTVLMSSNPNIAFIANAIEVDGWFAKSPAVADFLHMIHRIVADDDECRLP